MATKPSTVPLWATNGGTTVEPLLAEKQAGWLSAKKLPARWMNWRDNLTYLWILWLQAYESEAHIWTALQTFSNGVVVDGAGSNLDGCLEAFGTGNKAGLFGWSGPTTGAFGVRGFGLNGGAFGKNGVNGIGGSGTTAAGAGLAGEGGVGAGSGGIGGPGAVAVGGELDGTTNSTGAAGAGALITGGAITSDADSRVGGAGVKVAGGLGQAGYGPAIDADHGDLMLDDGSIVQASAGTTGINQLRDTQVAGDLEVTDDLIVTDNLTVGSITIGAPSPIGPLLNSPWANFITSSYWKNAFGELGMRGTLDRSGATNGSTAFTLPVGDRPTVQCVFLTTSDPSLGFAFVTITTAGAVIIGWTTGFSGYVPLDVIRFRTT